MYMHVAVAIVPSYLLVNWLTALRGYCTNHCGQYHVVVPGQACSFEMSCIKAQRNGYERENSHRCCD